MICACIFNKSTHFTTSASFLPGVTITDVYREREPPTRWIQESQPYAGDEPSEPVCFSLK